ncbi:hypothetical protein D3C75_982360 [compost metagenome]
MNYYKLGHKLQVDTIHVVSAEDDHQFWIECFKFLNAFLIALPKFSVCFYPKRLLDFRKRDMRYAREKACRGVVYRCVVVIGH